MKTIIEVIEESDIELVKLGGLHRGYCPFHDDTKTPNLTVYPSTNSFYCYSCGIGGDVITFVREFYNLSYPQALEKIGAGSGYQELAQKIINAGSKESGLDEKGANYFISRKIYESFIQFPERKKDIFKLMERWDGENKSSLETIKKYINILKNP